MSDTKSKKIYALKIAPWWKRLLAYTIDNIFLFIILTLFIRNIYGDYFLNYLDKINEYGGLQLGIKENIFSQQTIEQLSLLNKEQQNLFYFFNIILNKYAQTIFILSQILSTIYYALFWRNTGQTIGAKILKIKVLSPLNEKIPFFSLFSRIAGLKLIETAWGIPALIIVNPLLKQRLHDSLSNTVVIEELSDNEEQLLSKRILEQEEMDVSSNSHPFDDK